MKVPAVSCTEELFYFYPKKAESQKLSKVSAMASSFFFNRYPVKTG